jgi:hypothetical protein
MTACMSVCHSTGPHGPLLITCDLPAGHDGTHHGVSHVGRELIGRQWTDDQALALGDPATGHL